MKSERSMKPPVTASKIKMVLRRKACVSPTVLDQLNNMSDFAIRTFIADGGSVCDSRVSLPERIDVLTSAVAAVLERVTTSFDTGLSRIVSLEEGFTKEKVFNSPASLQRVQEHDVRQQERRPHD